MTPVEPAEAKSMWDELMRREADVLNRLKEIPQPLPWDGIERRRLAEEQNAGPRSLVVALGMVFWIATVVIAFCAGWLLK